MTAPPGSLTLRFVGILTTETTVSVCPPHLSQRGSGDKRPMPIPRTPDGRPLIPAGTLRGSFRRACWRGVYKRLCRAAGQPVLIPYAAVIDNIIGGSKGSQSERPYDPAGDLRSRLLNPHQSLFGRNQPWMEGKIKIGPAIMRRPPESTEHNLAVTVSGKRSDPIRSGDVPLTVLPADDQRRYNENVLGIRDKAAMNRRHQALEATLLRLETASGTAPRRGRARTKTTYDRPAGIDEATAAHLLDTLDPSGPGLSADSVRAALWASQQRIERHRKTLLSDVSILLPLAGYEGIGPGSECDHEMFLEGGTEIEVGLLLHGLHQFALTPFVGGHRNHLNGKVSLAYEVFRLDEEAECYVAVGTIRIASFGGLEIVTDDGLLADCLAAWKTAAMDRFDFLASENEPAPEGHDEEEAVDA
jgi:hypothetical protein